MGGEGRGGGRKGLRRNGIRVFRIEMIFMLAVTQYCCNC